MKNTNYNYNKKSQISIVELSLLILLFISFIPYLIYNNYNFSSEDINLYQNSFLNALIQKEEFRNLTMSENISSDILENNWQNIELLLNNTFRRYELIIQNNLSQKTIFSNCPNEYNHKLYSKAFITISNNTNYEFKNILLGVCY